MALGVALLTRLYLYDPSDLIAEEAAFVKPRAQVNCVAVPLCQFEYVKRLDRQTPLRIVPRHIKSVSHGSTPSFGPVTASAKGLKGVGACCPELNRRIV